MPKLWEYVCVALLIGFGSAYAQQQPATADEIKALVVGKELQVGTVGIVTYKPDMKYEFYGLNGGGTSRGIYRITEDQLCVDFNNGYKRCDQILKDGGRYYLKNSRGTTYEMVPR
jgi:hypothetical protein